jgi:hypothetical protein
MGAQGTATVDFGAAPGTNVVSVTVSGQAGVVNGSAVEAWIMGADSTASHTAYEHMLMAREVEVTPTLINAGAGFVLTALTQLRLTGLVAVRWVWN